MRVFTVNAVCLIALVGEVPLDPAVRESSGLVVGTDGRMWTHGDSGTGPTIFAINLDGDVVQTVTVDATNTDWEDIARHGDDLLIADIGNNSRKRETVSILVVPEPDGETAKPRRIVELSYPEDVGRFDAEAFFVVGDRGYIIEKVVGVKPRVFGFDLDNNQQTLELLTTLPLRVPVTGADAADGILAVSTVIGIYRFDLPDDLADLANAKPTFVRKLDPLMEAVAIEGDTIWATSEQNLLRRFDADAFGK